jgi:hypothetical protein
MSKDSEVQDGTQGEQPTSESSQSQTGQQRSNEGALTKEEFVQFQNEMRGLVRGLQGEKDRAVKKTNQRMDNLEGDIRTLLQTAARDGKTVNEVLQEIDAQEEAEFRASLREVVQSIRGGQPGQAGGTASNGVNVQQVVSDLELDPNDVRVKEFMSRSFDTQAEANLAAAKLVKSISKNQPTDADRPGNETARTSSPDKQKQLQAEYEAGAKTLRGVPLMNWKRTMRAKGWQGS